VRRIRELRFPVFAGGISPLDTKFRGKLMWFDVPGRIGGVAVKSGDLVFGDVDGVVIIPQHAVDETMEKAMGKVKGEDLVRERLEGGESLQAMFEQHGIL
jgi:regulator of RNase E activity RraA